MSWVQKSGSKTRGRTRTGAIAVLSSSSAPPSARTESATLPIVSVAASRGPRVERGRNALVGIERDHALAQAHALAERDRPGLGEKRRQELALAVAEQQRLFRLGAKLLPERTGRRDRIARRPRRFWSRRRYRPRAGTRTARDPGRRDPPPRVTLPGPPLNDQTNLRSLPSRPGSTKSGIRSPGRRESGFVVICSMGYRSCRDSASRLLRDDNQDTGSARRVASQVAAVCG